MKMVTLGVLLLVLALPWAAETQEVRPPELKDVKWVPLVNVEAEEAVVELKETLKKLNVYIYYKAVSPSPSLVLLSGKKEDVLVCAEILSAIDRAHAEPTVSKPKVKYIPLEEVGARTALTMIRDLEELAGPGIGRGRFIVYPETADPGLFFIGSPDEAAAAREFALGVDRRRYRTRSDILGKWWRDFSADFLDTLQKMLTYLACALCLLLIHTIVSHIPVLGEKYRKHLGLIWAKLLAGFKGQDFALSLIEAAAGHGAAVAAAARHASGADRYAAALEAAKRYLRFRGLDTSNRETEALLEDMVAARTGAPGEASAGRGSPQSSRP